MEIAVFHVDGNYAYTIFPTLSWITASIIYIQHGLGVPGMMAGVDQLIRKTIDANVALDLTDYLVRSSHSFICI